jgi:aerobic carbon-monoxide dehydrogenase medium subunit
VAVALDFECDRIRDAHVVVGSVDEVPLRVEAAEQALDGAAPGAEAFAEAGRAAAGAVDPSADVHGTAQYRKDLTDVLVRRALAEAVHADRRGSDGHG